MPRRVMRWLGFTTKILRSRSTHSSDSRARLGMRYLAAQIRCAKQWAVTVGPQQDAPLAG